MPAETSPSSASPPSAGAFTRAHERVGSIEGERLVAERVYFDQATILSQLGLAHDPRSWRGRVTLLLSHPLTLGRALLGAARERGAPSG